MTNPNIGFTGLKNYWPSWVFLLPKFGCRNSLPLLQHFRFNALASQYPLFFLELESFQHRWSNSLSAYSHCHGISCTCGVSSEFTARGICYPGPAISKELFWADVDDYSLWVLYPSTSRQLQMKFRVYYPSIQAVFKRALSILGTAFDWFRVRAHLQVHEKIVVQRISSGVSYLLSLILLA